MKNSYQSISKIAAIFVAMTIAEVAVGAAPLPRWDGSLPAAGDLRTSQEFQDFTVYSFPYLDQLAAKSADSVPGDDNYGLVDPIRYLVQTGPGQLHDKVVLMTGNTGTASENADTCGPNGCDDAYAYPSPVDTYFSSMTDIQGDPDPLLVVPGGQEASRSTWTAEADALKTFLDGGDLTFLFNLNEDNGGDPNTLDGQALLLSARADLTNVAGDVLASFYLGANNILPGINDGDAALAWAADGEPEADPLNLVDPLNGSEDSELYDPQLTNLGGANGWYSEDPRWAYIHGAISVDKDTGLFLGFGDCGATGFANCETVNQNLGARRAAFAAFNQDLNDAIHAGEYCVGTGAGEVCQDIAFMNVDIITAGQSNGFEQALIMATNTDNFVPVDEAGTLPLLILGLLTLVAGVRNRKNAQRHA